ncbi:MAG: 2-oxoacid:acceptor oxidoreductase subunit alpha, partial [Endomicrobiia bacterium]
MNSGSILICGQAGQGIQTIGYLLAKIFINHGYYIFAWQDFQSRIRGGESSFRLVFDENPVYSLPEKFDIMISLDENNTRTYFPLLKETGLLISEETNFDKSFVVAFKKIAQEIAGEKIYSNSAAIGSICGVLGLEITILEKIFSMQFADKGEDVIKKNIEVAKYAANILSTEKQIKIDKIKKLSQTQKILITGNESISLGAIVSGCKFMSAYPMTPSTGIITYLSETSHKTGILTEQVEDEISAINMALGASYAGVRSLTATSGGGFCLMVEGLSLSAMTEIPIVIILGQRPGPATGLPTRTEQGELNFALNAGHGEFPRFIFAPSDAESAFYTIIKAFDLSQKYRVPSIILTDQFLADSYWTMDILETDEVVIKNYFLEKSEISSDFKTYKITETGISPRIIPGETENLVIVDSDEHDERGNLTEDNSIRKLMVAKRWKKFELMKQEFDFPKIEGNIDAEIIL